MAVKVAFFISSWGHGRGGHFYSLKTIREALPLDSIIINYGRFPSPVYQEDEGVYYVDAKLGLLPCLKAVNKILKSNNFTHLHSFDYWSYLLASLLSVWCRLPLVHTKPGGPSPRWYFPFVKYLTVFSFEDFEFFSKAKYLGIDDLSVIANRLDEFETDDALAREILDSAAGRPILLRIARIAVPYRISLLQTLNLGKKLNDNGVAVFTVLVGVIQDGHVLSELKDELDNENVLLLTEERFTVNAKKILRCANIVVGTGRSFMEASLFEPVLLAPVEHGELPMLIDDENYADFRFSNFSGRGNQANGDVVGKVKGLLCDREKREGYRMFVRRICEEDFHVSGGVDKYLRVYDKAVKPANAFLVVVNGSVFLLKRLYSGIKVMLPRKSLKANG